ncbi:MAG: UDP-2,3-diacylglucosamine diphosphatase [Bacteroidetes bacterium]|nr:UDP-2,3-diacylglucosamine diphosphatase [Bacteroidota bacterium]MCH8523424.1 UDP-2,3-diacylglucosamine diphosphatase [Balneolales bacterium]
MLKRNVDVVVLSDVHLGTYGCQATELHTYLKSINPSILVLNGDIIDGWQFKKYYFPEAHMKVVRRLMKMMMDGTEVYYLTGNHDEMLRRFTDLQAGNFHLLNKLLLDLDGKKVWLFHGDVFDITMRYSKFIAKMGGMGYDLLILLNSLVNKISIKFGKGKLSLSKRIKDSVKSAVKFISDFEATATDLAFEYGYDTVICGHIHRPAVTEHHRNGKTVLYLNSGDWIENMTALEYYKGEWSLYQHLESVQLENQYEADDTSDLNLYSRDDVFKEFMFSNA